MTMHEVTSNLNSRESVLSIVYAHRVIRNFHIYEHSDEIDTADEAARVPAHLMRRCKRNEKKHMRKQGKTVGMNSNLFTRARVT